MPTGQAASPTDFVIVNVVRLRAPKTDDEWFRQWRDSYDQAACEQAGGVSGNAEADLGSHHVFIGTCAGGALTYHTLLDGGSTVLSMTAVGPGRRWRGLMARDPRDGIRAVSRPAPRPCSARPELSCRGWQQEAALRMLMNNLDPEVAEDPDRARRLRRHRPGGTQLGRLRRHRPRAAALADDETLLVQSGKPVAVFRTHPWAPRVLIANSNLVGKWATWESSASSSGRA